MLSYRILSILHISLYVYTEGQVGANAEKADEDYRGEGNLTPREDWSFAKGRRDERQAAVSTVC